MTRQISKILKVKSERSHEERGVLKLGRMRAFLLPALWAVAPAVTPLAAVALVSGDLLPGSMAFAKDSKPKEEKDPRTDAPGVHETDVETELRLALKPSGYEKIRRAWAFESNAERTDVYLDVFEQGHFQMRSAKVPVKARFMSSKKETKWQVAELTGWQVLHSQRLTATAKETHRIRVPDAKGFEMSRRARAAENFYSGISKALTLEQLHEQSEALWDNDFVRESLVAVGQGLREGSRALLLPAEVSKKDRLETQFRVSGLELDLVLGMTSFLDAQGASVLAYEVEADCDGPWGSRCESAFRALLDRFEDLGLEAGDLDAETHDGFAFAEGIYADVTAP